jgi:hypothetical protein
VDFLLQTGLKYNEGNQELIDGVRRYVYLVSCLFIASHLFMFGFFVECFWSRGCDYVEVLRTMKEGEKVEMVCYIDLRENSS